MTEPGGSPDRTFLVDAAWNEEGSALAGDRPAGCGKHESTILALRVNLADANADIANLTAEREELRANVRRRDRIIREQEDDLMAKNRNHRYKVDQLRAELAAAKGVANSMRQHIEDSAAHECKSPLGDPTREEAIGALRRIRDRIQRFREGARFDRIADMVEEEILAVVPE
jgi:hypothetical protein